MCQHVTKFVFTSPLESLYCWWPSTFGTDWSFLLLSFLFVLWWLCKPGRGFHHWGITGNQFCTYLLSEPKVLIWIDGVACLLLYSSFPAITHITLPLEIEETLSETRSTQCSSPRWDAVQHFPAFGRWSEAYVL